MTAVRVPVLVPTPPFHPEGDPLTTQFLTIAGVVSDTTLGNVVSLATDVTLILENVNVGAQTVTITSFPDANNRLGTITNFSIPATTTVTRRFTRQAWANAAGDLEILTGSVDILITPLQA